MVRFVIVRHGYSEYNKQNRFTGQADIPLAELGVRQAELANEYVLNNYKIDVIYASDLSRAFCTAKTLSQATGLTVNPDPRLRELNFGVWTGKTIAEVKTQFPKTYNALFEKAGENRADGGESRIELAARVKAAFEDIAKQNDGKTVAVYTHGGTLKAIYCVWTGIDLDKFETAPIFTNASVTVAEYQDGKANFTLLSYDKYLDGKFAQSSVL